MKMRLVLLGLVFSYISFAQSDETKRNQIGINAAFGKSIVYKKKSKTGFSSALNYTRISKTQKWHYEFGLRYTQLNYTTEKEFDSYKPLSDTFGIRTGNILFFDTPINFQRISPLNEKMNLILNLGCFFTTYIKWYERNDRYLTDGETFIEQNRKLIKPFNYFKLGFDFGLGLNRYVSPQSLMYIMGHLNTRSELDIFGTGYVFPNLTFGYKYEF